MDVPNRSGDNESDGFIGWYRDDERKDTRSTYGSSFNNDSLNANDQSAFHHHRDEDKEAKRRPDDFDENGNDDNDFMPNSYSEEFENDSTSTDGRWSLSVRLNSAVDLPSSIIPSMPLCPLMKFGLITVTEEGEVQDLEKSSAKSRRAEFESAFIDISKKKDSDKDAGDNEERLGNFVNTSNYSKQESLKIITSSGKKGILAKFQEKDSLEECISKLSSKPTKIQCTTGKIMTKKDNGMMQWNEEMRWDDIDMPLQAVLCVELSARAVFPPNILSAMETLSGDFDNMSFDPNIINNNSNNARGDGHISPNSNKGGLLGFWRKGRNNRKQQPQQLWRGNSNISSSNNTPSYHGSDDGGLDYNDDTIQKEMEKATAAAAVARYLMENHSSKSEDVSEKNNEEGKDDLAPNTDNDVKTSVQDGDIRLGTLLIPISNLPLEDEVPTVEKWFQFDYVGEASKGNYDNDTARSKGPSFRSPSALLQISLSAPDTLDELEEDTIRALDIDGEMQDGGLDDDIKPSFHSFRDNSFRLRRGSVDTEDLRKEEQMKLEEAARIEENGPYLEPGLIDHICVVGPKGSGTRINMSTKGWIEPEQESCILEQFPPEGFNLHGRDVSLPNKVEWWCFPEGCKLWCGSEPPTHMDMNLKRFSASSPKTMAASIAAFDACLDCTSSFMWWVMSSNSDEYGSNAKKTYGAVIRFYAPVPNDPLSQKKYSRYPVAENDDNITNENQKLWCPIGICITSSLPIIGIMEAILLRICERLSSNLSSACIIDEVLQEDVLNLICNFQSPIPGIINCSIPFLDDERLLISLPPRDGLPPLPHGASVVSVCRLLGADGLNALLASVLTECKILIHSADVANLSMVAEVVTSLIYPFEFQLPYVPVIPISLMEVLEAPVSYFVGVPTCNMKYIDSNILTDVVVIDLDNGLSTPNYFDGRRGLPSTKTVHPLPALISNNISKAVFKLLKDEQEVEDQFANFSETRHFPRLDGESLAERNFRITVAQQICSLIRGYQECLFFVSVNQPVFNRDRFLRQAPALFEERPIPVISLDDTVEGPTHRILSPRSKRFLSGLVNTQHFYDLLERLDNEEISFFHQIMDSFQQDNQEQTDSNQIHIYGTEQQNELTMKLGKILDNYENEISVYHVHGKNVITEKSALLRRSSKWMPSFTAMPSTLLRASAQSFRRHNIIDQKHSLQQLLEIQERPWQYTKIFDIDVTPFSDNIGVASKTNFTIWPKIQLKQAMGDRKFRIWKERQQEEKEDGACFCTGKDSSNNNDKGMLHLLKLIPLENESQNNFTSHTHRNLGNSIDERDVVRQYIEKAYEVIKTDEADAASNFLNDSKWQIQKAMYKPSAQRFLVSILGQRSRLQNERQLDLNSDGSISEIHPLIFECLVRLCNAMLEVCIRDIDYESAYRLLTNTTGFCTTISSDLTKKCFLTKTIIIHPIFKDMRLWDRVLLLHKQDRQKDRLTVIERSMDPEVLEKDEYEATVSTLYDMIGYGIQSNELAKFASRIATDKLFSTDSEQKILMLARKLAIKCDDADCERDSILFSREHQVDNEIVFDDEKDKLHFNTQWEEISWSHPVCTMPSDDMNAYGVEGYAGQTPITALASFGSSVVASGALDGSIFVANTFNLGASDSWESFASRGAHISGARLEWQRDKYGVPLDPTGNVGAISCLATSKGFNHLSTKNAFDVDINSDSDAIQAAIEGCRIIGGTTVGDLRMWSLQDILVNHLAQDTEESSPMISGSYASTQSNHMRSATYQDASRRIEARSGSSLGNHRGGVTCLSVPEQTYRPDSLISGGNDGLIKLWSLRQSHEQPMSKRGSMGGRTSRMLFSGRQASRRGSLDDNDVLSGHGGPILCLETAWHGDRLLSGAADLTVKLWDLSIGGSNCIQTMHGHTGWVTQAHFWGRNTAISASTDRSIALWDSRTGNVPIFALRHHRSPISDLYIESRNAYWMTSAGSDGVVATWDCRKLSSTKDTISLASQTTATVRVPRAKMKHCQILQNGTECSGPVMLAKGVNSRYGQGDRTIMSVSTNGFINEWDVMSGRLLTEHHTAHSNSISCFKTYRDNENLFKGRRRPKSDNLCTLGGTITAAWDGKIKIRRMLLKKK